MSSTGQEGPEEEHEQERNSKIGQRAFDLLQDLQNPESKKELKSMLKTRSWKNTLRLLKEINKTYQDVRDELLVKDETVKNLEQTILDSREEFRTLRTKYQNLKKHFTNLQKEQTSTLQTTETSHDLEPQTRRSQTGTTHTIEEEPEPVKKRKLKMPDPPIFQNDGTITWEDWFVDMKVKLNYEPMNERQRMGTSCQGPARMYEP